MHAIVETRRAEIADLYRRHHVKRLDVFGSAAIGTFDPDRSDIDFLVEFEDLAPLVDKRTYFALHRALQTLFPGKDIDLVTATSVHNPVFQQTIYASRELLYG